MTNMQARLLLLALSVPCINGLSWGNDKRAPLCKLRRALIFDGR